MEQFSLEKYLENPNRKVVTRDGREAIIVCTNADDKFPVVAKIQGWDAPFVELFNRDGIHSLDWDGCIFDLFFADEKDELTEFEKALSDIIGFWQQGYHVSKDIKIDAKYLLAVARKELEKEGWRNPVGAYKNGYEQGKQDALKDLPKLEKTKEVLDPTIPVMYTNAASMKSYVEYNGYKVCINELFETLPKEE